MRNATRRWSVPATHAIFILQLAGRQWWVLHSQPHLFFAAFVMDLGWFFHGNSISTPVIKVVPMCDLTHSRALLKRTPGNGSETQPSGWKSAWDWCWTISRLGWNNKLSPALSPSSSSSPSSIFMQKNIGLMNPARLGLATHNKQAGWWMEADPYWCPCWCWVGSNELCFYIYLAFGIEEQVCQ